MSQQQPTSPRYVVSNSCTIGAEALKAKNTEIIAMPPAGEDVSSADSTHLYQLEVI
jgi:hypothetical protein